MVCLSEGSAITNLSVTLEFQIFKFLPTQKDAVSYKVFFVTDDYEVISDINEVTIRGEQIEKTTIALFSKASTLSSCMLALQSVTDSRFELQQLIPFNIDISFVADFDF